MATESFLDLPPEIRMLIYKHYFRPTKFHYDDTNCTKTRSTACISNRIAPTWDIQNRLLSCQTINNKATPIWFSESLSVQRLQSVSQPWHSTQNAGRARQSLSSGHLKHISYLPRYLRDIDRPAAAETAQPSARD